MVASPDYLQKRSLSIDEIANAEKIATTGYTEGWAYWFEKNGYTAKFNKPSLQFDHSSLAIQSAMQGLGVLLVKDILVQAELKQGRLLQVWQEKVPCLGGHYVICNTPQKASAHQFIKWLKKQLATEENVIHTVEPYE
ncbi:LysR substrate-binding domain-containing protein [Vibrio japonicus]|uniref:LysR substrate-binding domain-containing protein n=1 Tax=Vibrio japonicus TaxID=1824638 RepID=A0ABY5LP68_9VIBR|nr:LysR substrate-binding domain-containing protein [Vibrio japonicus]UUM32730.1 LysR substrate-binding domain-containing protein [Vibrio japonicus]